ncbi:MAG: PAS domain S-box protein [Oscillochloris sp.]|nr:PAS domain S-box protein [Oscillochloris sp.]
MQTPAMLQCVLDTIPFAIAWKDRRLCYLGCNAHFAQLIGLSSPEAIIEQRDDSLGWAEHAEHYREIDESILKTGSAHIEDRVRQPQPDGTTRWLRISRQPLADPNGSVAGVLITAEDITAQIQVESPIRESEATYRTLIERIMDGIFVIEHERVTLVNSALARMVGYTTEELIGMPFIQFIAPEDRAMVGGRYHQRVKGDTTPDEYEARLIHKDATTRIHVIIGVQALNLPNISGTLGMVKDITERKQSEAQLHSEKIFSETMLNSMPGIFYMFNRQGTLVRWNENYHALLGRPVEQLRGLQVIDTFVPDDRERVRQQIQEVFTHGMASMEAAFLLRSGQHVVYYLTGRHIRINEVDYLVGTGIDITERKQMEAERARLQEEVIVAQESALRELSTPLIPFSDEVMVMPLIGSVDSRRAQQVIEALLEGIAQSNASIAILDITGVVMVDTQVANALVRAAQAVKLLGAQVVLTGIRPEVAQTLVGLGVDLAGIITCGTLQNGIAFALEHTRRTGRQLR